MIIILFLIAVLSVMMLLLLTNLSIQGDICGFINIPLPTEAMGNSEYWCHSA